MTCTAQRSVRPTGWTSRVARNADPITRANAGLTLVEVLVVLGILALVGAIATPQVLRYLGAAKTQAAQTQISNLTSALELYYLDTSRYPDQRQGLTALVTDPGDVKGWNGPYIRQPRALTDPWGRPYLFRSPGKKSPFDVFSLGRDGVEGGDGEDKDVSTP